MRNCLVAQSGGPTVAINASLAGVIQVQLTAKSLKQYMALLMEFRGY